jgi:chromosome segregation ATPase
MPRDILCKFIAIVASTPLLATGNIVLSLAGLLVSVVSAALLFREFGEALHKLGEAATNAQEIREQARQAEEEVRRAREQIASQAAWQQQAQDHAVAAQQNLERAQNSIEEFRQTNAEIQQINEELGRQIAEDRETFAAFGERLTEIAARLGNYTDRVQVSIQNTIAEIQTNREQIRASIAESDDAIQSHLGGLDEIIQSKSDKISSLVAQQRTILESALAAHANDSEKSESEKLSGLSVAINQAIEINARIAETSAELHTESRRCIVGIKDVVHEHLQRISEQFEAAQVNLAEKVAHVHQLVAYQGMVQLDLEHLRRQQSSLFSAVTNGDLADKIARQEALLAGIQGCIEAGTAECNALGSNLRQIGRESDGMAGIVANLQGCVDRIGHQAQYIAAGISLETAIGFGGGAAIGAGFVAGLPGVAAVAAGGMAGGLAARVLRNHRQHDCFGTKGDFGNAWRALRSSPAFLT